jgi:ABC-type phosphate transport system substrate-binding protein
MTNPAKTSFSSSARALWAPLMLLSCLFVLPAAIAAPAHVVITVAPGAAPPAGFAQQLSSWRQSGEVSNALWLDEDQKKDPGFASMMLLEFPSEASYEDWNQHSAPQLATSLVVKRADVLTHGEVYPRDSNKSVFLVNTYKLLVPRERYNEFVQQYILPNLLDQKAAHLLLRYTMFVERGTGDEAQAVLVMEYRDSVAFSRRDAQRDELVKKLRATNVAWRNWDDTQDSVRKGTSRTLASYIELPPPQLPDLPHYVPEYKVVGGLRIVGSELKNAVEQLALGFQKFQPDAKLSTSNIPSSEGGIAGLYYHISDVAPMGDDAKITDMMPFHDSFGYMPTEVSVATGGYEKRGSLWAFAVVVSKDNPLNQISVDELERIFGAERSGGWELADNDYLFTARFARASDTNIRKWGQVGLKGQFVNKEIKTFGYAAPGFAIYIERNWFHWSKKWNPNLQEYVEDKQAPADAAGAAVTSEHGLDVIAKDKYAIGLAALMHVKERSDLKVLAISPHKGEPAVQLTPANVANRTYPLIRDAFFYLNKEPGRPLDPRAREFMRFVLSREGQEIIARMGYYYPLPAEYLREQLKKLD